MSDTTFTLNASRAFPAGPPVATEDQVWDAYATDLEFGTNAPGGTAYRHRPGPPVNDLWWLRHGIVTDIPYPGEGTP
jgi:hypothetical protein